MRFDVGMAVRIRNDIPLVAQEAEGTPSRFFNITLVVARCGRFRDEGRRYMIVRAGFDTRWVPGSFLRREIACMFEREV